MVVGYDVTRRYERTGLTWTHDAARGDPRHRERGSVHLPFHTGLRLPRNAEMPSAASSSASTRPSSAWR